LDKIVNHVFHTHIKDYKYVNEKYVENFLLQEMDVSYDTTSISYFVTSKKYIFDDTAYWEDRKSFRKGKLIIDIGYDIDMGPEEDYVITLLGYKSKRIFRD
jgi:hypothetical protein